MSVRRARAEPSSESLLQQTSISRLPIMNEAAGLVSQYRCGSTADRIDSGSPTTRLEHPPHGSPNAVWTRELICYLLDHAGRGCLGNSKYHFGCAKRTLNYPNGDVAWFHIVPDGISSSQRGSFGRDSTHRKIPG